MDPDASAKAFVEQYYSTFDTNRMFHLIPTPQGSYYVLNDIFRLNYA
ncbi:Nuclear transport factor 2 [Glycine soja]|uniref:Nuclear transport factor 2 n=1 Tax=Glycine soja TaxID=3848 RepID=A0A0B2QR21_GLYSO|nr:Nuclear transport factor 2 [Glycine soja]